MGDTPMNGLIARTLTALGLAGAGLAAAGGCYGYRDLVDPCYPQRYTFQAREEVKAACGPAVLNGHVLDQTVWNYHFEPGTATLTPAGLEHLAYLGRRRPCPDPTVYLQVAQDIPYDQANPFAFVEARNNLDARRTQAILDYLNAQTAGRSVAFTVVRHDPSEVGISAVPVNNSIRGLQTSSQGVMVRPVVGTGGASR
jgi:hypothetical protein